MIRTLSALALVLAGVLPAGAQQTAPRADELLALNFYIQQQDKQSVDAELRRLQLKYPDWTPPQDLSRLAVTVPTTEIDAFYRHVADGRFEQARQTLAQAREAYPDWDPPAEMTELLEVAEGQVLLDAALDAANLPEALRIAGNAPGLLRCDRINNAWRIAEAQQAAGSNSEALGTYRAVLNACINHADLVATLEKADQVASEPELQSLFTQVTSRFPQEEERYSTLRQRLLAGRGLAPAPAPAAPKAAAAARPQPRAAEASRPAAPPVAQRAPSATPSPAPRANAAPAASARAGSLDAYVAAGDWAGCLQRSAGSNVAAVVYQRGWCAYNLDRPMEAITAFRTALSGRLDATQRRDAGYGIALAYLKMNMPEEAARISAVTDFTRSQRVDIERQILDQRGVLAYENRQYRQAIQYFDALEEVAGGIRRDLAILRAYAYLNSGDRNRARQEFRRLNSEMSTRESRAGLAASTE